MKSSVDFIILMIFISLIVSNGVAKRKEQRKRTYTNTIGKRIFSDQRLAELEALIIIEKEKQKVAHGLIDPWEIGKRKRSLSKRSFTETSK